LLNGEDNNSEEILKEKRHWWSFLSKEFAGVSVLKLKQKAQEIKNKVENKYEREKNYCDLLHISEPLVPHLTGPKIKIRKFPPTYDTTAWEFRWIYTFILNSEGEIPKGRIGYKWTTKKLRNHLKKKEVKKLFKRASYTTSVSDGTPEIWSEEPIEVKLNVFEKAET